jgi:hypothetical protein
MNRIARRTLIAMGTLLAVAIVMQQCGFNHP